VNTLEKSIEVRCSVEHAFSAFVERVDLWWPPTHRKFPGSQMILEGRAGGRFLERAPDGRDHRLGEVIECDPPHYIKYSWYPGAATKPTEVVVRFQAAGRVTRVNVLHAEGGAELGLLWPERAQLFDKGWNTVLPAFKMAAE
jgi:uncharacterized protein YndB with AHSA1/START domain